jgi:hypothetical protein
MAAGKRQRQLHFNWLRTCKNKRTCKQMQDLLYEQQDVEQVVCMARFLQAVAADRHIQQR